MKKHFINIISTAILLSTIILFGCEKDFLDINEDPNNPIDVPLSQSLTYAQVSMANSLSFSSSGLTDQTSSHMHQTTQRGNFNLYLVVGNDFNITQPWGQLYGITLTDLRQVIRNGEEQGSWHYVGVAKILKAYTYSIMVDMWGDIPFTEANLGSELPYPAFEDDKAIYTKLFLLIDEAILDLAKDSERSPTGDDLIYGGDLDKWVKFANTLKLKLYNQVRLTDLYDATAVASLISSNELIGPEDDFEFPYGTSNSPENRNPAYIREYANIGQPGPVFYISPYFYQILQGESPFNPLLNGIEDPRIPYYFYNQLAPGQAAQNPTSYKDGEFVSIWFASFNIDPNEGFGQSQSQTVLGLYPAGGKYDDGLGGKAQAGIGAGGAMPLRLLPYYAHLYIRAELALTKDTGEDHAALFEQAMEASFDEVNEAAAVSSAPALTEDTISSYVEAVMALYNAADVAGKLELIMTQKWIASFGFSVDQYTDYRRTGYPELFDPNTDNNPLTQLNRLFPLSLPYNTNDLDVNPNAPSQRNITTDRIFWDVN